MLLGSMLLGVLSWSLGPLVGTSLALGLAGLGAWFLWGGRKAGEERRRLDRLRELSGGEEEPAPDTPTIAEWRDSVSNSTRSVVGLGTMIFGYHLLAWSQTGLGLATLVDAPRWWMIPAAGVGLTILSRAIDRGAE